MFVKLYLTAALIVVFGNLGCLLVDGFGTERQCEVAERICKKLTRVGVVLIVIFVLECIKWIWVGL